MEGKPIAEMSMAGYLDSNAIILALNVLDGLTMFSQYCMMSIYKTTHPERAVLIGSKVTMLLQSNYFSFNHQNIPYISAKTTQNSINCIIFALTHFTFFSSPGLRNSNETEMSSSLNREHVEPSNKEDMKKYYVKKSLLLLSFAAVSSVMATAHPHRCPPSMPRAKVMVVKKAPKKVETVVVKKKNGKTVVVKKVNGRFVTTKTIVRR